MVWSAWIDWSGNPQGVGTRVMKVLVIGSGGREHALAWKIAQSPLVDALFAAPGNAGTAQIATNVDIAADRFDELVRFVKNNRVDLTVVGPEGPLCAGIADVFAAEKLKLFGPSRAASRLEASKVFCKKLIRSAAVPCAEDHAFDSAEAAERFINERYSDLGEGLSLVVKADGLAAGKGAIVCRNRGEVFQAIDRIARRREFGDAGNRFLLEEMLRGWECSVLAATDGRTIVTLPVAQDHKRAWDGDRGPNTGGMGAFCPAPLVTPDLLQRIESDILVPTVHALNRARSRFQGILFGGLMVTANGPKVLEFNVRFGDPECQAILPRLRSDWVEVMLAVVEGNLEALEALQWDDRPTVCVVMASEGYPDQYTTGLPIRGLDEAAAVENVQVFHAGTRLKDGQVVTAGGRVLSITACGATVAAAKLQAYRAVKCIRWQGAWCRKDIGDKAFLAEHASLQGS
jgi:phosphoribosylamine--glycine ligase